MQQTQKKKENIIGQIFKLSRGKYKVIKPASWHIRCNQLQLIKRILNNNLIRWQLLEMYGHHWFMQLQLPLNYVSSLNNSLKWLVIYVEEMFDHLFIVSRVHRNENWILLKPMLSFRNIALHKLDFYTKLNV
jgi:hypothetical protein